MNKKQAFKAIVFVGIFLFLLRSVTYMLRTNGQIKDIFLGFYAEPKNTIDVVLIGSSPVYPYYIAPKIWGEYGMTCYPLSSSAQRPEAGIYLVKEALKSQTPALFVFELRQYLYDDRVLPENMAFVRGVTDNLKYSVNRVGAINALVPERSERYTYYFDIIKYHSNWRSIVHRDQYTALFYERQNPTKGYIPNDAVMPGEAADHTVVTDTLEIAKGHEEALRKLLAYLRENGQEALFIVSPTALTPEQKMMLNYTEEIIESCGYSYLDMNDYYEEIGIDFGTDFYDGGGHTNALGAEKCTAFLAKYLSENYDIGDKRQEAGYESWDRAYELWKEQQSEAMEHIRYKIETGQYDEREKAE